MKHELAKEYRDKFNNRDLVGIENLLAPNVILSDPQQRLVGKSEVVREVKNIFDANPGLIFETKNIYISENPTANVGFTSILEFRLELEELTLEGIDVIDWLDNKIIELRAYVNLP